MSGRKLLSREGAGLEAASGFEPLSRGFADLRLDHLATPPRTLKYRGTPRRDQELDARGLTASGALRRMIFRPLSGNNSVVECDLAKVEVAGSNPVSRSIPAGSLA